MLALLCVTRHIVGRRCTGLLRHGIVGECHWCTVRLSNAAHCSTALARLQKAAKVLGVPRKKLRMATPKDVHEATGCVTGAVPPFGSVFSIPTFVDNSLQEQGSTINFNAVRDFPVASPRHWDAVHSRRLACAMRPRDVVVVCNSTCHDVPVAAPHTVCWLLTLAARLPSRPSLPQGLRTKSVSMTVADYMQVEHPTVASLSS